MDIIAHKIEDNLIAEITNRNLVINTIQQGTDLVGELCFQGYSTAILCKENFSADFFDLKNGMAGEVLQKFANYRIRLFIVGDFERDNSKSLKDFIFESNQSNQINFVKTLQEAIDTVKKNKTITFS